MSQLKAILASTDFSDGAAHACWRAGELAAELDCSLRLLHVVEADAMTSLRSWLDPQRDYQAAILEQARMLVAAQAEQIRKSMTSPVDQRVELGERVAQIRSAALSADLLVMGAHGLHPLRDIVVGTTADRLVRTAPVPVLVAKRAPAGPYRCVLVLTDFSADSDAALNAARSVAPQAAIHLLHAINLPFEGKARYAGVSDEVIERYRDEARLDALARMKAQQQAVLDGVQVTTSVEFGDPRVAGMALIKQLQPDLVAVGKQGQSMLQDMFLGSTTSWMLGEAPCDVLVVPQSASRAATSGVSAVGGERA